MDCFVNRSVSAAGCTRSYWSTSAILSFALVMLFFVTVPNSYAHSNTPQTRPLTSETRFKSLRLPLSFEPNVGQASDRTRYVSRTSTQRIQFMQDEVVLECGSAKQETAISNQHIRSVSMKFVDANRAAGFTARDMLQGKINYLLGSDPTKWKTNIPTYGRLTYSEIYSGIDLTFYGTGEKLEYDYLVDPMADPRAIALEFDGVDSAKIDEGGALLLSVGDDTLRFEAPVIYQSTNRGKRRIAGGYYLTPSEDVHRPSTTVSFRIGEYDRSKPLIIDPVLNYSTFLGGSDSDYGSAIAIDSAGYMYVVGTTSSVDFPTTPGAVFPTRTDCNSGECEDAFITKLNPSGNALVYSTYLGGSNYDYGTAIAVDASGNAYVTGSTQSTDFPTTAGALQRSCGGTCFYNDAFVAELNSTGSALIYSTYLGGSNEDDATGISVNNGNTYVSGFSASSDFPVTPGAFQTQVQGQGSSFVVELNNSATALTYGTFIGEVDLFGAGPAIHVDSAGNSYLAGVTLSSNFPLTQGAFHTPFFQGLITNAYIAKLNPAGSDLVYSAGLGGVNTQSISVDSSGEALFAGTAGPFYPISPGALNSNCAAGTLVGRLSADGSMLDYSGLFCAQSTDLPSVTMDRSGNIFLFGDTSGTTMPTTVGAFQPSIQNTCCFSDTFLAELTPNFSALSYSTYFGGSSSDFARGSATDNAGNIYLTGGTSSSNFPLRDPLQGAIAGSTNVFISKFAPAHTTPQNPVSIYPSIVTFGQYGLGISSSPIPITVANISKSVVLISSITLSGDFTQTNNCGTTLSPGEQCTVQVIFKPAKVGILNGSLNIMDGAGAQQVQLSGTGVNGSVVAFSSNYEILNQPPGYTSPPLSIVISNLGNKNLKIYSATLEDGGVWNFFGNTNCLKPVEPNGHCIVRVDYTPDFYCFNGETSSLELSDNAVNSPQYFGLRGQCESGNLVFASYGVRFDPLPVGTKSSPQDVAMINGSSSPIPIGTISATSNFMEGNNCPTSLDPGAFCYLRLESAPKQVGILQGTVTVTDSSNNVYTLPLLGTGTEK